MSTTHTIALLIKGFIAGVLFARIVLAWRPQKDDDLKIW